MMTFEPLWETMKNRNITGYALINKYGMSRSMWDKLRHNRNVNLSTIDRLCEILDCDVSGVVKHIPQSKKDLDKQKEK